VTLALILDAPAHGVWPPLLIANWQLTLLLGLRTDNLDKMATASETSWAEVGEKMQLGLRDSACWDQYELIEVLYAVVSGYDTLLLKANARKLH